MLHDRRAMFAGSLRHRVIRLPSSDGIIVTYKNVSFYHILQFEKDRTVKPMDVLERIVN